MQQERRSAIQFSFADVRRNTLILCTLSHSNAVISYYNHDYTTQTKQLMIADFALVPPAELRWIIHYIRDSEPVFVCVPLTAIMSKHDVIHKTKVHKIFHCLQSHSHRQHTENFVKFELVVFEIRESTDRQTHSSQYSALLPGVK